jgi:RNA-binding protein
MELTGKQRRHLRALAHHLDVVATVGTAGITDAVVDKVDEELGFHELIKVKVSRDAPEKAKDAGPVLAERTNSHLAQVIGHTCVLYRARKKKPTITLPTADA